ncbi:class I SAM-dependent methyltransferase [Bacterioplanoides pacificum]|uniref:Ribosomal RNA small subunit methyltransferase J n=1 Tax=Bacterioplanoides pacificum TaxID=1171596 RepID=A0ABV7VNR7_9GAMM
MKSLVCLQPQLSARAEALAAEFALQLSDEALLQQPGFHLCLDDSGLSLQQGAARPGKKRLQVQVDFVSGAVAHRRKFGGGQGQDIARAIGISAYKPTVIDATAGLGRDSFVLASLGCRVTAFERQPVIAALFQDGLERGLQDDECHDIIQRIELHHGSGHDLLQPQRFTADVVYLDPMFEHDEKARAQVKKDMQAFREVVGQDDDADDLLQRALACARCRVVVKRARKARPLADQPPTYSLTGKANRFDIYVNAKVAAPAE